MVCHWNNRPHTSPFLTELENTYEKNQRILEDKAKQLVQLEETVRSLLQAISQKAAVYSTC